jgi:hypothetical protein
MERRQLARRIQISTGAAIRFGRVAWTRTTTKAAFSANHNAMPVQTIVLVMMRPPANS